jgi:hypothetical protein
MDETNDLEVIDTEEETPETDLTPETDWQAEAIKARGIAQRLRTKLTKATEKKVEPVKTEPKTGDLDKADYAYFAAKGYDNDEDIEFLQSKMSKWDMNAREILKDEDVIKKLAANKIERDVRAATPGSMKRASSGTIDNVDYWLAKYEQTGELPDNFELRSAVVNAKVDRESPNKPSWR